MLVNFLVCTVQCEVNDIVNILCVAKKILSSTCDILGRWRKEVTWNGKRLKPMKVEN